MCTLTKRSVFISETQITKNSGQKIWERRLVKLQRFEQV